MVQKVCNAFKYLQTTKAFFIILKQELGNYIKCMNYLQNSKSGNIKSVRQVNHGPVPKNDPFDPNQLRPVTRPTHFITSTIN